ncbi:ricin-type beta-trefoil lectin domain protein (plasmid) [Streptomyces sp. AHU1]|uniref:ricin-type beta-trefoil lectin domain protein n=1 Tax=Streptomyces sp. AHU1 TaxID=3377215 RepID=UPI0038780B82
MASKIDNSVPGNGPPKPEGSRGIRRASVLPSADGLLVDWLVQHADGPKSITPGSGSVTGKSAPGGRGYDLETNAVPTPMSTRTELEVHAREADAAALPVDAVDDASRKTALIGSASIGGRTKRFLTREASPTRTALIAAAVGAALLLGVQSLVGPASPNVSDDVALAPPTSGPDATASLVPRGQQALVPVPAAAKLAPGGKAGTSGAVGQPDIQLVDGVVVTTSTPSGHGSGKSGGNASDGSSGQEPTQKPVPGGSSGATPMPSSSSGAKPTAKPVASATPSGRFIVSFAADQCITSTSGKDGQRLKVEPCSSSSVIQHWQIMANGTIQTMGLCMDAAGAGTYNGTVVQLAYCNGGEAQHFVLNSSYDLVNVNAHKCVALVGGGTAAGTALELRDCNGKGYQKWRSS